MFGTDDNLLKRTTRSVRTKLWKVVGATASAIYSFATDKANSDVSEPASISDAAPKVPQSVHRHQWRSRLSSIGKNVVKPARSHRSGSIRSRISAPLPFTSRPPPVPPKEHPSVASSYPSATSSAVNALERKLEAVSEVSEYASRIQSSYTPVVHGTTSYAPRRIGGFSNGPHPLSRTTVDPSERASSNDRSSPSTQSHHQSQSQSQSQSHSTSSSPTSLPSTSSPKHIPQTLQPESEPKPSLPSILRIGGVKYTIIGFLAMGGTARVLYAQDENRMNFAVKVVGKAAMYLRNRRNALDIEKVIMRGAALRDRAFLVALIASAHDEHNVYFVMRLYCSTLGDKLHAEGALDPWRIKCYFAEILVAYTQAEHLGVIHRDIKPTNILISPNGHLALGDFGNAYLGEPSGVRDVTCKDVDCTPGYAAPETYTGRSYNAYEADMWSLGVIFLEMWVGVRNHSVFLGKNPEETHQKVLHMPLDFAKMSPTLAKDILAQDLLNKLLNRDHPRARLSVDEIKAHPFFFDIDWEEVENRKLPLHNYPREVIRVFLDPRINAYNSDVSSIPNLVDRNFVLEQLRKDAENPDIFKFVCPPEHQHDPLHGNPIPC